MKYSLSRMSRKSKFSFTLYSQHRLLRRYTCMLIFYTHLLADHREPTNDPVQCEVLYTMVPFHTYIYTFYNNFIIVINI